MPLSRSSLTDTINAFSGIYRCCVQASANVVLGSILTLYRFLNLIFSSLSSSNGHSFDWVEMLQDELRFALPNFTSIGATLCEILALKTLKPVI